MIHLQLKRDRSSWNEEKRISSEKLNSRSRTIGWVFQALETAQMVCSCPRAVESALSTTKGVAWEHNQVWPPTQKRTGSKETLHFQDSILGQLRFGLGDFLCWTGSSQLDSERGEGFRATKKGGVAGVDEPWKEAEPPTPSGRAEEGVFTRCLSLVTILAGPSINSQVANNTWEKNSICKLVSPLSLCWLPRLGGQVLIYTPAPGLVSSP